MSVEIGTSIDVSLTSDIASSWIAPGKFFNGTHYLMRAPSGEIKGTVVFIHGIGSYHVCFNRLADFMVQNGYQTLQYDLYGRGFSDLSPNGKYSDEEHIEQLVGLLDHVYGSNGATVHHLIAHSMGGSLATLFTSRHPQYVRSLTLLSPAGMMGYFPLGVIRNLTCIHGVLRGSLSDLKSQEKIWRKEFINKDPATMLLEEECVRDQANMFAHAQSKWIEAFVGCVLSFPMTNVSADIERIASRPNFPVHLLWGRKDGSVPYNNKRKWTAILKKGQCSFEYRSYASGHVFFQEEQQVVQRDILNFINSIV